MTSARGTIEMTLAMAIAGTTGWMVILSGQDAIAAVFWRCLFGAAAMLIVCVVGGQLRRGAMTLPQFFLALAGGVALVMNWVLLFAAYSDASIGIATVTYHTQPFMLTALSALLFAEKITLTKAGWLLLAFVGLLMIVAGGENSQGVGDHYLRGILLALGAAFCYAGVAITARYLKQVVPQLLVLIQLTLGALLLLPLARLNVSEYQMNTWLVLIALGAVHTGLMSTLLYSAIGKLPGNLVAALSFLYPVIAVIVDWAVFGHRLGLWQFFGGLAILLAAAASHFNWTPEKISLMANAAKTKRQRGQSQQNRQH
ncbi:DMT family transporter [Erwinia sp. S43]|uniref:DMT family transporter n=1 Tax=unclassified Erwinia TaxID=2622719 RepID=UPI001909A733|nr:MULTISPECIES: DMT family transporter [unclassified Erwinia]MBK0031467.1 DMT family transporter [Erwinia sp. S43]MCW1872839.1 DMT family transporter [Erwinia sp. INIA01]